MVAQRSAAGATCRAYSSRFGAAQGQELLPAAVGFQHGGEHGLNECVHVLARLAKGLAAALGRRCAAHLTCSPLTPAPKLASAAGTQWWLTGCGPPLGGCLPFARQTPPAAATCCCLTLECTILLGMAQCTWWGRHMASTGALRSTIMSYHDVIHVGWLMRCEGWPGCRGGGEGLGPCGWNRLQPA